MPGFHKLTVKELRLGLDEKKFSSLELTKSLIERAKAKASLNAYITLCEDSALREAELADKRIAERRDVKTFTGIPVAVKDLIATEGIRTTAASKILANFIPPYDATTVSRLKSEGAVVIGKTNCDEFGMGSSNENSSFGVVKNPWDQERVPGGSSGGSAAVVSAGLAPVALGTDTGGSIRQPASLCNLVGLKPTYGRVSRYGLFAYASSLDTIGPFGRTVSDVALCLQSLAGKDQRDATTLDIAVPNYSSALGKDIKNLKIGIPKEYFVDGLQPEVGDALRQAMKLFESMGAKLVDISLPHTKQCLSVYYIIAPAEASSNLARYDGVRYGHRAQAEGLDLLSMYCRTRTEGFGPEVKRRILIGTHVLSTGYYDAYYVKAQKVRALVAKDFSDAMSPDKSNSCDLILSPTAPTTAFKFGAKVDNPLEMYLSDVCTIPVSLAGLPALSLPCGFDKQNLPIGMQLISKHWREDLLLKVAFAYEQATDWHKRFPTLAN